MLTTMIFLLRSYKYNFILSVINVTELLMTDNIFFNVNINSPHIDKGGFQTVNVNPPSGSSSGTFGGQPIVVNPPSSNPSTGNGSNGNSGNIKS